MSIFDFLFARAATPEQRNKNIFLDAIDGGGRFASFRDVADDDPNKFRGGPLGISALLNALGVDPYGSTDAQPSSPPARTAPVAKPAQQSAPPPAATPNLVDFIAANTGLRPSTNAELTAALEQPVPPAVAPPIPAHLTGPKMGMPPIPAHLTGPKMGMPPMVSQVVQEVAPLNLLNAQVEAAMRDSVTNYFDTAMLDGDKFLDFVRDNGGFASGVDAETLARQYLNIAKGTAQ